MANTVKQSMLNKARKDKFILHLSIPLCLQNIATSENRAVGHKSHLRVIPDSLQYSVYGSIVPTVNVPSIEVDQWGHVPKISSHSRPAYDDVTVNFTVDNEFNNYWYIWKWLDILNDAEHSGYDQHHIGTSESISSYLNKGVKSNPNLMTDYQTDISITAMNEYEKGAASFVFTRAFPVSIGDIDYSYRDSTEVECSFTFSFFQMLVNLL